MTNWKYNIYLADLRDEFEKDENDNIDIKKCADTIYERLKLLKDVILENDGDPESIINGPSGLDHHIKEFGYFNKYFINFDISVSDKLEEFNTLFDNLYDFADGEFIWINVTDETMSGIGKVD